MTTVSGSRGLAIVETPLQLLCAYEATAPFPNSTVILRMTGVGQNDAQTAAVARRLGIECVLIDAPVGRPLSMFFALWALRGLVGRKFDAIYLGSYFSGFIRSIAQLFRGRLYFLDDGMATLLAQKEMKRRREPHALFTFFNVAPMPGQICIRHSFTRLRGKFPLQGVDGSYFIGQPMVEKSFVDPVEYRRLVELAAEECLGELIYIPHRAETAKNTRLISSLERVRVVPLERAIELELLAKGMSPRAVYSCCSTALLTLTMLFPDTPMTALVPASLLAESRLPHLHDIVAALQSAGAVTVRTVERTPVGVMGN